MLEHKKRRYNTYNYQPETLKTTEENVTISPPKPKNNIDINMFDAIKNTHQFNRAMLKTAYSKKGEYITHVGDKAAVAGTDTMRDWYDNITKIPNWNKNNRFSNITSDVISKEVGAATGTFVGGITENPELGVIAGTATAKKVKDIVMDKTKDIGNTKAIQRYGQLEDYLKKNPGITQLTGHSMSGTVILEKQMEDPFLTTYTYNAPVLDLTPNQNIQRYRVTGDVVSVFDRGAKTFDTQNSYFDILANHSLNAFPEGYTENTQLSDGTEIMIQ